MFYLIILLDKVRKFVILFYALWIAFNPVVLVFAQTASTTDITAQLQQQIISQVQTQTASLPTSNSIVTNQKSSNVNSQINNQISDELAKIEQTQQEVPIETQQKVDEASKEAASKLNDKNATGNNTSDNEANNNNQLPSYAYDGPINQSSESANSNTQVQNSNNENVSTVPSPMDSDNAQILTNANIDPVQTSVGDVQISGSVQTGNNDGSVKVQTGNVKIQGEVFNQANTNTVSVNQTHHSNTLVENKNKNLVVNLFDYFGSSGQNTIEKNDGRAEIDTGNVDIRLNLLNLTNTNITNSTWGQYFYNSEVPLNQDINIEEAWHKAAHDDCKFGECAGEFKVVNMNESTVQNKVKVLGISGQNKIKDADGDGIIRTGDVRVATNLINFLNTNLTGSEWDLSVINLFDDWKGDLILPGKQKYDSNKKNYKLFPNTVIDNKNDVLVSNEIVLDANTGNNLIDNNDGVSKIKTGDALTKSNIQNVINANFQGGDWFLVIINRFNNWEGKIFNKPTEIGELVQDKSLIFSSFLSDEMLKNLYHNDDEAILSVTNNNLGELRNEILIQAMTGGNEIQGNDGDAVIETGKALILANVLNIANVSIAGGDWHLAVINVFGDWHGNIFFGKPDLKVTVESNKTELYQPGEMVELTAIYSNTGSADGDNANLTMSYDSDNLKPLSSTDLTQNKGKITWDLGKVPQGTTKKITQRFEYIGKNPTETTAEVNVAIASPVPDLNIADNTKSLVLVYKNNKPVQNPKENSNNNGQSTNNDNNSSQMSNNSSNNQQSNLNNNNQPNSSNSSSGSNNGSVSATTSNSISNSNANNISGSFGGTSSSVLQGPVEISKSNSTKGSVKPGETVSYVIRVKNISVSNIYGLVITDTMKNSAGTIITSDRWEFEEVKSNKGFEIKYDVTISNETPSGIYTNYAKIEGFDSRGVKFTAAAQSVITVANETLLMTTLQNQNQTNLQQAMMTTPVIKSDIPAESLIINNQKPSKIQYHQNLAYENTNLLPSNINSVVRRVKETLGKVANFDSPKPTKLANGTNATFTPRFIKKDSFYEENASEGMLLASGLLDKLTNNYPKILILFVVIVYISTFLNFGVIYEGRATKNRKRK